MTATIVCIPDRYTCRGITFLPHGQQFKGSVPAGEYDILDPQDVCYSDLGRASRTSAYPLVNIATGEKWYVSLNVGKFLMEEHLRPLGRYSE